MQPTYTAEAEAYREKVQAFLAEKLPSNWQGIGALEGEELETFVTEWRNVLYAAKYLAPGWPVAFGGAGLDARPSRSSSQRNSPKPASRPVVRTMHSASRCWATPS